MATYEGQKVNLTYKGLLKVSDDNTGVTSTAKVIESADGTASALGVATTHITVNGFEITATDDVILGETDIPTELTGDVTGTAVSNSIATTIANNAVTTAKILASNVTTAKIADSNVTYAKIQNVSATDKLLGRSTAGAGVVEEITCTSAGRALIDDADASAQRTTLGLGNMALQAKTAVDITGGDIVGITDLAIADGGTGQSTASAAFTALKQDASDTTTGVVELAVQSEMEAGTDTGRVVVPGRQHYHPSAAKAWVNFNGSGVIAIGQSYNVTSLTDNGTGDWTVTYTNAFTNSNNCVVLGSNMASGLVGVTIISTNSTTAHRILNYSATNSSTTTKVARDDTNINSAVYGDL